MLGLYPVAQVREPYSAIGFLAERIPLENIYHLKKPIKLGDNEWSAFTLAERFSKKKGYRTRHGGLDTYRGGMCPSPPHSLLLLLWVVVIVVSLAFFRLVGNEILRDATEGRLVFFFYPPPLKEHYLPPKGDTESLAERVRDLEEEQPLPSGEKEEEAEEGKEQAAEEEKGKEEDADKKEAVESQPTPSSSS